MSWYRVLGVPQHADAVTLREAWQRARAVAPVSGWPWFVAWLRGRTPGALDAAYAVLSDPRRRAEYDLHLESNVFTARFPPGH